MIKRFYKKVEVVADGKSFKVLCDGKSLKNMQKSDLFIPTEALANAIAWEWDAQQDEISLENMPLTNLLTAVVGLDEEKRAKLKDDLLSFISTDVLCYRASYPADLVHRQKEKWNPVLQWLHSNQGIELKVVEGVLPAPQALSVAQNFKDEFDKLDDFRLVGLYKMAAVCTSVALGMAVVKGFVPATEAFNLSRLEELYQNELWGTDMEAAKSRNLALDEVLGVEKFLKLAGCLE